MNQQTLKELAKLMRDAMERRRDKPSLAVLAYMQEQLEICKVTNIMPDWGKIFKQSRKIYKDNL